MSWFTPKPKISASQREDEALARNLRWMGNVTLVICVAMTAMFGWTLGTTDLNRVILAAGSGAIDVVGVYFMRTCGRQFAKKHYGNGVIALVFVSVFSSWTAFTIFGFQSANRTAVAKHHAKTDQLDLDMLGWYKSQAMDKNLPKPEKQTFLAEVKAQVNTIKTADTVRPEEQANQLGLMLNKDPEDVQRWLLLAFSVIILLAQFGCQWFQAFIKATPPEAEADAVLDLPKNRNLPPGSSNGTSTPYPLSDTANPQFRLVPDTGQRIGKFSKAQALRDLQNRLAAGEVLPEQNVLVELYKRPKNTISAWVRDWQDRGLISRTRDGNRKVIGNPPVQSSVA